MRTTERFVEYVLDFYGPGGIYAKFFAQSPVTEEDVKNALPHLLALRAAEGIEFDGDSYDREVMRDILLVRKDIQKPWHTEYETRLKYYTTPINNAQEGA